MRNKFNAGLRRKRRDCFDVDGFDSAVTRKERDAFDADGFDALDSLNIVSTRTALIDLSSAVGYTGLVTIHLLEDGTSVVHFAKPDGVAFNGVELLQIGRSVEVKKAVESLIVLTRELGQAA